MHTQAEKHDLRTVLKSPTLEDKHPGSRGKHKAEGGGGGEGTGAQKENRQRVYTLYNHEVMMVAWLCTEQE